MNYFSTFCVGAACLMTLTSSAQGTELHLTLGNQTFSDPAYGLVSYSQAASMAGVRVSKDLKFGENLAWVAGYEFGNTYRSATDYESVYGYETVSTTLDMHAFEFGLRAVRPVGRRLQPYAAVGARAVAGILTVDDDVTGWSMSDPSDPTGESYLYELDAEKDVGLSLGVDATLGLALRFNGDVLREAQAAPTAEQGEKAASEEAPVNRRQRREWGLYIEGGYMIQTALMFTTSGSLGLGGPRIMGGAFVDF